MSRSSIIWKISRSRNMFWNQSTLNSQSVQELFQEPGVINGYRQIGRSWTYYARSIFQLHNETLNIWTHMIASVLCLIKTLTFLSIFDISSDTRVWPFLAFGCCITMTTFLSALAHIFHSKSPFWHYLCFQVDYAGIGLYGLGKSILFLHASCPESVYEVVRHVSLPMNVFLAWLLMLGCCMAKLRYKRPYPIQRRLLQLGSGSLMVCSGGIPIFSKYINCWFDASCSMPSLNHHTLWLMTMLTSLVFFSSHLPEKQFPGKFDYVGQGHQVFHVLIGITAWLQFDAAYYDIINREQKLWTENEAGGLSLFSGMLIYIIGCGLILLLLVKKVRERIQKDDKCT